MEEITPPKGEIIVHKLETPQKVYFFERFDGSVICVQEQEANTLLKGRIKVLGPQNAKPKLIGVSDGMKFYQAVQEAHALHREGKTAEALQRLRDGETEELEAARGHIERPRDFDAIDTNRNPVNIGLLR
jgi:hypothetical protein